MVGSDVRPRFHRQHGERLADVLGLAPDAGNGKDGLAGLAEQPLVLPLLLRVGRRGELVEAIGDDEAAVGRELAALGAKIVDRLSGRARPAPPTLDELAGATLAFDAPDDRRCIGDLDVLARLDVGSPLGKPDFDLQVLELLDNRG